MSSSQEPVADSASIEPCRFEDLNSWDEDDHLAAFNAFLLSAQHMLNKPYRHASVYCEQDHLLSCALKTLAIKGPTSDKAKRFFEENFIPHHIKPIGSDSGFVTGFYEPVVDASLVRTGEFQFPLYQRPPELIDINDENRPSIMDSSYRFGQEIDGVIKPYLTRSQIQQDALEGRNLELVWLRDKTDVFFIHVQGSAKLRMTDGSFLRVTYAAKAGHPYTSVAKVLCEQTGTPVEQMTSDRLAAWMRANPDGIDDLLAHNQSYIFFKKVEGLNQEEGPIAAAKVSLTAGRSMAVDRLIHSFGLPFWVETLTPLPDHQTPWTRLMIAQDTGSAIVGPARGDLFMGSGDAAGLVAGRIRHDADLTVLVPKP